MVSYPTPIPLPANDYDRPHTTTALLASLRCTTTSFDAIMDTLLSTTSQHVERLKLLERRVLRARGLIAKLEKMYRGNGVDNICRVEYPAEYSDALKGIEMDLLAVQSKDIPSALDAARAASDAAVRTVLRRDAKLDDGMAVPSDEWLDQPSMGIGDLTNSLEAAEAQRRTPLLYRSLVGEHAIDGSYKCMDETEYREILDSMDRSESRSNISRSLAHEDIELGDDESVYSATSRISALSMSSNFSSSGRITSIQRRKWHEQQKHLRNIRSSGAVVLEGKDEDGVSKRQTPPKTVSHSPSTISGRQQAISGSQPYLCEVLHDSYGIGSEPPKGLIDCSGFSSSRTRQGGTEFYPPPSSVTDFIVFNTSRNSYGLANRRAAAMSASSRQKTTVVKNKPRDEAPISHN